MPTTSLDTQLANMRHLSLIPYTGHTTVSVTNGVGVHARGGLELELELDCAGIELEKLRSTAGWERRASRPSRNKERPEFMSNLTSHR